MSIVLSVAIKLRLNLTDPIGRLVHILCIECDMTGAVKAITAVCRTFQRGGGHVAPPDAVIGTMREPARICGGNKGTSPAV